MHIPSHFAWNEGAATGAFMARHYFATMTEHQSERMIGLAMDDGA